MKKELALRIIIPVLVDVIVFVFLLFALYFMGKNIYRLRFLFPPSILFGLLFLGQGALSSLLSQRFLKSKKQVILIKAVAFASILLLLLIPFLPGLKKIHSCRGQTSNTCRTIRDGAKVLVAPILAIFLACIYIISSLVFSFLLMSSDKKKARVKNFIIGFVLFLVMSIFISFLFGPKYQEPEIMTLPPDRPPPGRLRNVNELDIMKQK